MLLSALSRYKLARRSVRGNYHIEQFGAAVSAGAKAVMRGLLVVEPGSRLTAAQCLHTPWLQDTEGQQVGTRATNEILRSENLAHFPEGAAV